MNVEYDPEIELRLEKARLNDQLIKNENCKATVKLRKTFSGLRILLAIAIPILSIVIIGIFPSSGGLIAAGTVFIVGAITLGILSARCNICPHCGAFMGKFLNNTHCPFCGNSISYSPQAEESIKKRIETIDYKLERFAFEKNESTENPPTENSPVAESENA